MYVGIFEAGTHCVAQAGLQLKIFLSLLPWDYRYLPHIKLKMGVKNYFFNQKRVKRTLPSKSM
jgi:hypothetical protein